jgi:hypothetical protein
LLEDEVEALITETRQEATQVGKAEGVEKELGYFVGNVDRMRYGTFRQQGFFIGSGVIEAGCKTVIGTRLKRSGMFCVDGGIKRQRSCRFCSQRKTAIGQDAVPTL